MFAIEKLKPRVFKTTYCQKLAALNILTHFLNGIREKNLSGVNKLEWTARK